MLIYLSGPMTGYEDFNYPRFRTATERLRQLGYDVINPAETAGGVTHLPRATFMSIDVGYVEACDAVVVLPGWHRSQGAILEVMLAHNLGKPVYVFDALKGIRKRLDSPLAHITYQEVPV